MEVKWHKYADEKPDAKGDYLTCSASGKMVIRQYGSVRYGENEGAYGFINKGGYSIATDVIWWLELPVPPDCVKNDLELKNLRKQMKRIRERIKEIEEDK